MTDQLEPEELVSFKETLIANAMQVDTLCQLFIEKGIITMDEFFKKLKVVEAEYRYKAESSSKLG